MSSEEFYNSLSTQRRCKLVKYAKTVTPYEKDETNISDDEFGTWRA